MTLRIFGWTNAGRPVHEISLAAGDLSVAVLDWGAVIRRLDWRGAAEGARPLVLGLDRFADYEAHSPHMGAVAGRFGNRIGHGRLSIDGVVHPLPINHAGLHHLHGGTPGFGCRPWTLADHGPAHVTLTLHSPDGDQGYPGAVDVSMTYRLEPTRLAIEMTGRTDRPTVLNLATHSYFNLDDSPDILDHRLMIPADAYCPVDATGLVTGAVLPVEATPYDFRRLRPVRTQLADGGLQRFDNNYALAAAPSPVPRLAARLEGARGDVAMEVWSSEPGIQLFDSAPIGFPGPGLDGRRYAGGAGLCLEPQRFPDCPNHPHFPDALLRPGETYRQHTEYRFQLGG